MDRIIVTNAFVGICGMQVCVEKDATDKEILAVANAQNPSGTTSGWTKVIRENDDPEECRPVVCKSNPNRLHLILTC